MRFQVHRDDLDALARAMVELTEAGHGWINLVPGEVDPAELSATRSVPGMIFGRIGGRGGPMPKITWTAPERRRRRTMPAALGIEHPSGPKARQQLVELGHPVPTDWAVLQDHAIRGLVVAPTSTAPDSEGVEADHHIVTMRWAITAAELLSHTDLGEVWHGEIFRGR
jgi:hypothetical protein